MSALVERGLFRRPAVAAALPALAYLTLGLLYIRLSTGSAARIAPDVADLARLELAKGQLFVLATGALVFLLLWAPLAAALRARRREQALESELAEAQARNLPALFASSLAHDLNNVLQIAFLHAETLADASATCREAARPLRESLAELASMVERLRAVARSRDARGAPASFELDATIADVVRLARRHRELADCRIESRLDAGVSLSGDRTLLARAVLNLLLNAGEASPGGTVAIATAADGERIRIEVGDDGPGIPESERPNVFRPFYTTKALGTGIGLASVQAVAAAYGGSVAIDASPLGGARFRIELPRPAAPAAPLPR